MKPPFELFIGFTGCGYTYCNKRLSIMGNTRNLRLWMPIPGILPGINSPKKSPVMCCCGLSMIPMQLPRAKIFNRNISYTIDFPLIIAYNISKLMKGGAT